MKAITTSAATAIALTGRTMQQIETEIESAAAVHDSIRESYVKMYAAAALPQIMLIGRDLLELKELCKRDHVPFEKHIEARFGFSQRTGENYMKIAAEISPDSPLATLPYTKAVALLGLPAADREAFAAENDVAAMSKRELQAAVKARKEAEEARDKAFTDKFAAEHRASAAEADKEKAEGKWREAVEKLNVLSNQLETAQQAPAQIIEKRVEVEVVPADYEAMKAQLAEARSAQIKAEADRDAAQQRADEAEAEIDAAEAAKNKAVREANDLRRKMQDGDGQSADPLSPESFRDCLKAFFGVLGAVPNMAAYFAAMPRDRRNEYAPYLAQLEAWCMGARGAINCDPNVVDVSGTVI